jgi:protein-tyrosine-phosphatase
LQIRHSAQAELAMMHRALMLALLLSPAALAAGQEASRDPKTVVFVCEHGTVKSVIAMAYFERFAREAGLRVRAISRGTAPDSALPPFMRDGLRSDRLDLAGFTPRRLTPEDLAAAALVVSFDQPDVARLAKGPLQQWDGLPSVSASYPEGREAIKRRVAHLVDSLAKRPR